MEEFPRDRNWEMVVFDIDGTLMDFEGFDPKMIPDCTGFLRTRCSCFCYFSATNTKLNDYRETQTMFSCYFGVGRKMWKMEGNCIDS